MVRILATLPIFKTSMIVLPENLKDFEHTLTDFHSISQKDAAADRWGSVTEAGGAASNPPKTLTVTAEVSPSAL